MHNKAIYAEKQIEGRKALNDQESDYESKLKLPLKKITTWGKTLQTKPITFNFKSSDSIKNAKGKMRSNKNLSSDKKKF